MRSALVGAMKRGPSWDFGGRNAFTHLANLVLVKYCGNGLDRGLVLLLTRSARVKE